MPVVEIPANALVILIGPPGCGKSTFARRHFAPTAVVSSDECRRLVSDDEADQAATGAAFEVFHAIIRGRLSLGRLVVADATNVIPASRARLRAEAGSRGAPTVVLALDVPLDACLAQNLGRARRVPPEIVELHYAQFEEARGALAHEGYDAVHVVGPETEVSLGPAVWKPAEPPPPPAAPRPAGASIAPPAGAGTLAPTGRVGLRSRTRPAPGAPRPPRPGTDRGG